MTVFIQYLVNGLSMGSVYAIIALGYTMVYGIAKMLNFAHGDVIMVGAYVSFCATSYLGLPGWASVVLSCVACTVLGVLIEGLAYKPLRQAPSLAVLITAIGVSYFLQNSALLIWKAAARSYPPVVTGAVKIFGGKLTVSYVSLLTIAACVVIMIGLTTFVNKSKMGKAMRACSEDKAAAQLMGINVNATISATFAIGSALAAIAGDDAPEQLADFFAEANAAYFSGRMDTLARDSALEKRWQAQSGFLPLYLADILSQPPVNQCELTLSL